MPNNPNVIMTANQADYSIHMMSRMLGVSRSGFYAHHSRPPSIRSVADEALVKRIAKIHKASKETYGASRIHAELVDEGVSVGRKRIGRNALEPHMVPPAVPGRTAGGPRAPTGKPHTALPRTPCACATHVWASRAVMRTTGSDTPTCNTIEVPPQHTEHGTAIVGARPPATSAPNKPAHRPHTAGGASHCGGARPPH